jgi:hypothetical protein
MNGVTMNTFTIDATNNITAFASLDEARAAKINDAEYFGSAQELAKLAASCLETPGVIDLARRSQGATLPKSWSQRVGRPHRARLHQRDADQEAGLEGRVLPFGGKGAHLAR